MKLFKKYSNYYKKNISEVSDSILFWLGGMDFSNKFLIYLICFVLMGVWFYFVIFQERIALFDQARENLSLQKQLFSLYQSKATTLQELLNQMEAKSNQFLMLSRALPGKRQLSRFVDDVAIAAKQAGVDLLSLKEGIEKNNDFYGEIPWRMEISGSYKQLVNFLFHIASMDRIVTIKTMFLKRENKKSIIYMDCEALTYRGL